MLHPMILTVDGIDGDKLSQKCEPITEMDSDIFDTLLYMFDVCRDSKPRGIGLALPQVGILKRGFVIDFSPLRMVCINPRIVSVGKRTSIENERCLSELKYGNIPIERPKKIEVEYTDMQGNLVKEKLSGKVARVFQHEMDHLDGILLHHRLEK